MGRAWAAVWACGAAGCVPTSADVRPATAWDRLAPPVAGGLTLTTGVVDRPAGDEAVGRDLWPAAARPLPHELSSLLAQNGVQVGVFVGGPPAEFAALWDQAGAVLAPTDRAFRPGVPRVVPVNGPLDRATLAVLSDLSAEPARLDVAAAECGLKVTAAPARGGQVRLDCEFQVQHGEPQAYLAPAADGVAFDRRERKALTGFPKLAFTVTLGPADALVVGPTDAPAGTLGGAFFTDPTPARPRVKVLVVRPGGGGPLTP